MVQEGQTFLWPRANDNRMYEIEEVGEGEPEEGFGSKLARGRVKLSGTPTGLDDHMLPGRVVETEDLRDEINPARIHRRRSDPSRETDRAMDAEVTTDPLQWASNPDEFDFPGVDTGPLFDETFDDDFSDF